MKVSCPSCQTNYNIDDKRIPPGGAKLKCARCQNTFPIRPGSEASEAVPLPGANPFAAGAVPLPSPAGPAASAAVPLPGAFGAVPLPGAASSAIPLPGASGAQHPPGGEWDAESTRVMTMPVPPAAFGGAPAAVPLPGAGRARSADFGLDMPAAPVALPSPAPSPQAYGDDDGYGFAPEAGHGAVPLPGSAGAIPLPGGNRFDEEEALPLPGAAAQGLGTARDFDFSEAPPSPVPQDDPFALPPPQDIDFNDLPASAHAASPSAAEEMDFSSLPSPADAFAQPPPAAAHELDFSSLPSPAEDAFALPPPPPAASRGAPQGMDFSSLPSPADEPPMASDLDFSELPAPAGERAPAYAASPDPSTDFGDVDFSEAPPPPPEASGFDAGASAPASAQGLEMLSFIDEGSPRGAGAAGAERFQVRRRSGKVFGPFDEASVVKMLEEGQLLGNEDVSRHASGEPEAWEPIGAHPHFG